MIHSNLFKGFFSQNGVLSRERYLMFDVDVARSSITENSPTAKSITVRFSSSSMQHHARDMWLKLITKDAFTREKNTRFQISNGVGVFSSSGGSVCNSDLFTILTDSTYKVIRNLGTEEAKSCSVKEATVLETSDVVKSKMVEFEMPLEPDTLERGLDSDCCCAALRSWLEAGIVWVVKCMFAIKVPFSIIR